MKQDKQYNTILMYVGRGKKKDYVAYCCLREKVTLISNVADNGTSTTDRQRASTRDTLNTRTDGQVNWLTGRQTGR